MKRLAWETSALCVRFQLLCKSTLHNHKFRKMMIIRMCYYVSTLACAVALEMDAFFNTSMMYWSKRNEGDLCFSCLIPQMCSYLVVNVSFLSWQNLRANKQYLFRWDVRLMSVYYPFADFFTWIWSKFVLLEGKYYCSHFILW